MSDVLKRIKQLVNLHIYNKIKILLPVKTYVYISST